MSFVSKMILFSAFMLLNILVMGAVSTWSTENLASSLSSISTIQLPAVKQMTLVDMHHDGIKGAVYENIVAAGSTDKKKIEEAKKGLGEQIDEILKGTSALDGMPLNADTKEAIQKARPDILAYTETAKDIASLAQSGKVEAAIAQLTEFEAAFDKLEKSLGDLGELIQADSKKTSLAGETLAAKAHMLNIFALISGILLGFAASAWIVFDLRNKLKMLLGNLFDEADQLQDSSNKVQNSSQDLSSATTEQSAAIEETVASMEEMSSMLSQTTQQAARNLEFADEGQNEAAKGRGVMAKMSAAMDEIQASNSKLDGLVRLISEIKEKTNVINEIVTETRLLSFNASIEAARAGAQGKGFAVVAEEVGKLAAMSGKAASDIHELLESSSTEVSQVVRDTQERVSSGKKISDECELMFNAMKESLEKIAKSTQMISSATKEQEIGVKQTNQAMSDMSRATQSNSQSVEGLAQQANALAHGAKVLHSTVDSMQKVVLGGSVATSKPKNREFSDDRAPVSREASAPVREYEKPAGAEVKTMAPASRKDSRWRRAA